jgi:hypothetical protein
LLRARAKKKKKKKKKNRSLHIPPVAPAPVARAVRSLGHINILRHGSRGGLAPAANTAPRAIAVWGRIFLFLKT